MRGVLACGPVAQPATPVRAGPSRLVTVAESAVRLMDDFFLRYPVSRLPDADRIASF
jgi:hypothetical protein